MTSDQTTDHKFSFQNSSAAHFPSQDSGSISLKHANGAIEHGLRLIDIEKRIRSGELSGLEMILKSSGGQWVRLAEDEDFYDLILHGLEKGNFEEVPKISGKSFQRKGPQTQASQSIGSVPAQRWNDKAGQQRTEALDLAEQSRVNFGTQSGAGAGTQTSAASQMQKGLDIELNESDIEKPVELEEIEKEAKKSLLPAKGRKFKFQIVPEQISEKIAKLSPRSRILLAALLVMGAFAIYDAQISGGGENRSARFEGMPASWRGITANTSVVASQVQDKERVTKGLQEAKAYYYRDTSFFYRSALKKLQEIQPFDAKSSVIAGDIAMCYLYLYPFAVQPKSYLEDIQKYLDGYLAGDPYSADLKRAKAFAHLLQGDVDQATSTINQAIAVAPHNPDVLLMGAVISERGAVPEAAGKLFDLALQAEKALVQNGGAYFARLHVIYARHLFEKGNMDEAINQVRTALAVNPIHPVAYDLMSRILTSQGKPEDALSWSQQADRLSFFANPVEAAEARYQLGIVYEKNNEPNTASLAFQYARVLDPYNPIYAEALRKRDIGRPDWKLSDVVLVYSKPDYFISSGKGYLSEEKLNEAMSQFEIAKLIAPENPDPYFYIGQVVERTRDFTKIKEAIEAYTKSVEIDPSNIEAHVRLGDLHRRYYMFDQAIVHLEKALKIKPLHPGANFYLGRYWEDKANGNEKELVEAIKRYQNVVINEPSHKEALLRLGQLGEDQLNDYTTTETYYRRYLSFFPDDLEVQLRLHINRAKQGRKAVAVKSVRKMLQVHPTPLVEGALGLVFIATRDYQRGLQHLERSVKADATNLFYRKRLAETYVYLGRIFDAVIQYKFISMGDTTDASGFFHAGKLLFENGSENKKELWQQALTEFKNAEELNYRFPLVHAYMAEVYLKLGDPANAAVMLKKEIQKNPKLVKYRIQLAELLLKNNYIEEASGQIEQALEIEPKNLQLIYLMSRVRREQGTRDVKRGLGRERLDEALKYTRLGLNYYPDAAKLFLEKGLIYREMGDAQQARDNLEEYLKKDSLALDRVQVQDLIKKLQ